MLLGTVGFAALQPVDTAYCCTCLLPFFAPCRIRQWTGDTRGWYAAGVSPIAGLPVPGQAYVFVYSMLTLAFLVLMLFRGAQFQHASLTGCQKLHKHMLHK